MLHAVQLGQAARGFEKRNTAILTVGPGGASRAEWLARLIRAPYPIAADPDRSLFRRFGLVRSYFAIEQSGSALIGPTSLVRWIRRATNPAAALDLAGIRRVLGEVEDTVDEL